MSVVFQLFCGKGYNNSRIKDLNVKLMSIIPLFVGYTFSVYNGKSFVR